jgi:hypothetical protein
LPSDSVEIVNRFYDFPFEAFAAPGTRTIEMGAANGTAADAVLDRLSRGSIVVATLPTAPEGPPLEEDEELAAVASNLASRLVERGARTSVDGRDAALEAHHIGMSATHRVMNARMLDALPPLLQRDVMVDTPERWQGLERPIMIVVHPISGTTNPTVFDLETGRLCVMASRHQVGLVVLTRDHLPATLDSLAPAAEQALGLPDRAGGGLERHRDFWAALEERDQVVTL